MRGATLRRSPACNEKMPLVGAELSKKLTMHQYLPNHQTLRLAALKFLAPVGIVDGVVSERSGCAPYLTNQHESGTHNHYKS